MKILVTGCAGLIGSHLCDILIEKGHTVIGCDNEAFSDGSNIKHLIDNPQFTYMKYHLTDMWPVLSVLDGVDAIAHLAAYKKAPGNSNTNSSDVMRENMKMVEAVVEIAKKHDTKVLFTSTSDVYSNHETFKESDPITIGPPTIERYSYAVSKYFDEQLLLNYHAEGAFEVVIARIFGCFSERSNKGWSGGHVPIFIDKCLNGEDIIVHGNGEQTRSMSYAPDIAQGLYDMLITDGLGGEIINIGTDEEMSVIDSARMIRDLTGKKSAIKLVDSNTVHGDYPEIKKRFANIEKAKKLINYKINYKTEDAIKKVIDDWKSKM